MRTATHEQIEEIKRKMGMIGHMRDDLKTGHHSDDNVNWMNQLLVRGSNLLEEGKQVITPAKREDFEKNLRRFKEMHFKACQKHVELGYTNNVYRQIDGNRLPQPAEEVQPVVVVAPQTSRYGVFSVDGDKWTRL